MDVTILPLKLNFPVLTTAELDALDQPETDLQEVELDHEAA